MGLIAILRRWQAERRERHITQLTAQAADLAEGQPHDLLVLHQRGFVRVRGTGKTITSVDMEVESLVRRRLRVVVPPGTYLVSKGGHQNMVTRDVRDITLDPLQSAQFRVDATCINAARPIPGEKDRFSGVARVSSDVARFLEASKGNNSMVIQAGVWTLTDNYSRYDVMNHLIARDRHGNVLHPVTHDHCDQAQGILEELGIKHRLWWSETPYEKKAVQLDNGTYSGEFRHGKKHGRGKYVWKDGDSYDGEWRNGKQDGFGVFTFVDGSRYEGRYANARPSGGWFHSPDGSRVWMLLDESGKWVRGTSPEELNIRMSE